VCVLNNSLHAYSAQLGRQLGSFYHRNISPTNFVRYNWHSRDTCTEKISNQLLSWDIIDIAGILVPQKYLTNLLREISWIIIDYHRLPLIIMDYHGLLWIIIDYHWLSLIIIDYHWISLIIIDYRWLSLIIIDYHWLSLIIIDYHWSSMIIICCHWLSLIIIDYNWLSLIFIYYNWLSENSKSIWLT